MGSLERSAMPFRDEAERGASEELPDRNEHRVSRVLSGQLIRFGIVGIAGFLVDVGLTVLLAQAGLPPWAARPPAIAVATVLTWGMNRGFTFRVDAPVRSLVPYAFVAGASAMINYGLFIFAVEMGHSIIASIAFATAVSMIASFIGYRRFAFGLGRGAERIRSR